MQTKIQQNFCQMYSVNFFLKIYLFIFLLSTVEIHTDVFFEGPGPRFSRLKFDISETLGRDSHRLLSHINICHYFSRLEPSFMNPYNMNCSYTLQRLPLTYNYQDIAQKPRKTLTKMAQVRQQRRKISSDHYTTQKLD